MKRSLYSDPVASFCSSPPEAILGRLVERYAFPLEQSQKDAWVEEIKILQPILSGWPGILYFEFAVPRMGKFVDVVLVTPSVIFVLEFKIGEHSFPRQAIDQVWDYALDLKNFHETSHAAFVAPILIATEAKDLPLPEIVWPEADHLLPPLRTNRNMLRTAMQRVRDSVGAKFLNPDEWEDGRYSPTPTIIEAAMALYRGHSVKEISRHDAGAINLSTTSETVSEIVRHSKEKSRKSLCFVTGVPGAGKTLVGLNIATQNQNPNQDLYSVFLSGNGPLVAVLREALARDKVAHAKLKKQTISKAEAKSQVKMFVQNVHHFRDECLRDDRPPIEHVAIFDEAQRAWNQDQTAAFMRKKKKNPDFKISEPEFLLSCLDRHGTWATVVCLVGGGQEINTGEAGIQEWLDSVERSFPNWDVYVSPQLAGPGFSATEVLSRLSSRTQVFHRNDLHLHVSIRSFRSEHVSKFVSDILDLEMRSARYSLDRVREVFPIVLTRDLLTAKQWLRKKARGSERFGMMVSSRAKRLRPMAVDIRTPTDPVQWFLCEKEDIRSSFYLEDVATEFQVQGLEIDWGCIVWDGDFRYTPQGWDQFSFCGSQWKRVKDPSRKIYQKNAYRVLLTRARQGMIIVVPEGDYHDPTRKPAFYDPTFTYLRDLGLTII